MPIFFQFMKLYTGSFPSLFWFLCLLIPVKFLLIHQFFKLIFYFALPDPKIFQCPCCHTYPFGAGGSHKKSPSHAKDFSCCLICFLWRSLTTYIFPCCTVYYTFHLKEVPLPYPEARWDRILAAGGMAGPAWAEAAAQDGLAEAAARGGPAEAAARGGLAGAAARGGLASGWAFL